MQPLSNVSMPGLVEIKAECEFYEIRDGVPVRGDRMLGAATATKVPNKLVKMGSVLLDAIHPTRFVEFSDRHGQLAAEFVESSEKLQVGWTTMWEAR
jgi:hypothetical protein